MSTPLDARAKRIIDGLIDSSTDLGQSGVERACGGDKELAGRVCELLTAIRRDDEFLGNATVRTPIGMERPGTAIGPYKLLQVIGEGGMGVVYMAEQLVPVQRKVALKIVKPGMDSAQVIARFEAERQALAMMDHLNIARVLDAGTTASNRPYFVMELVHGVPISQFCDERRLSPRERLQLFVPVCHAIQHAHQKGIIHRDIKPSNVLVTMYDDKPVPKVIDFGVAKAIEQRLTDRTMFTQFGALLGTAQYMSPEQAEMNAFGVDTRSDICSLGVLLYELLTGTTPLEAHRLREAAFSEMVRLIKEEEAPRPSIRLSTSNNLPKLAADRNTPPLRLSTQVRGDLDWIVMKCLEKDRARRYDSANGLACDIQRHLADEPVEACPPSAAYRLRKFARRYRTPICVVSAFVLVLIAGIVVSTRAAIHASAAEKAARLNETIAHNKEEEASAARATAENKRDELARVNQRLELANYVADMNLARHAWDENNLERLGQLLDRYRPAPDGNDLRGFEWHYLYRLPRQACLSLRAYGGSAGSARFLPDGRRLISGGTLAGQVGMSWPLDTPGEVKMWDAETGRPLPLSLPDVQASVWRVAVSPDGHSIAVAQGKDGVRLWNLAGGNPITLSAPPGEAAIGVAFGPDGWQAVVKCIPSDDSIEGDTSIQIWDLREVKALSTLHGLPYFMGMPALSADSRYLVIAPPALGTVRAYDAPTGNEAFSLKCDVGAVWQVMYSPDGRQLVGAGDGGIHFWDTETRQLSAKWPTDSRFGSAVAFSRDGTRFAYGGIEGLIEVWDAQSGRKLRTFKGHVSSINDLDFSPDGSKLVSSGVDGTIRVWTLVPVEDSPGTSGTGIRLLNPAVSPDGRFALTETNEAHVVRLINLKTGSIINDSLRSQQLEAYGWDAESRRLVLPDEKGLINIIDAEAGRVIRTFQSGSAELYIASLSADGKTCAFADRGRVVQLADVESGTIILTIDATRSQIHNITLSPDSRRLVVADVDGWVRVFDVRTGRRVSEIQIQDMYIYSVLFSPNGDRVVVTGNLTPFYTGEARVIDADTGGVLCHLRGHSLLVVNAAFSPDGRRIATASSDGTARVWELTTGQELLCLRGHETQVLSARFLDGGSRLLSVGADGATRIWDATPVPEKEPESLPPASAGSK